MGLVEFLLLAAEDCGVPPERIEACVQRQFSTVENLAGAMHAAGLIPRARPEQRPGAAATPGAAPTSPALWLTATACRLADTVQPAASLNQQLQRPLGWLERHAGIQQRRVWQGQDPLEAALAAARECLERGQIGPAEVEALLVTSEAPPLLTGLAAALHHRLELPARAVALEIGNACTGFLAALWLARSLPQRNILVIAVEAPTRYLTLQPGPAGETAALFGDAAAACLLDKQPHGQDSRSLVDVVLGAEGSAGSLIQVAASAGQIEVRLQGEALATRAIQTMVRSVRDLVHKHALTVADLQAAVVHGGNGRFPGLLARRLGVAPERVWSQTSRTGNLGSASLPAAWAAGGPLASGPVIWTAVGAGLTWGAALWK